MTEQRRITPGNLARVALADIDDNDSVVYWDANEPVATARTKRVTIADLRSFVLSSPVVVGTDPDSMSAAAFRVGGDSLLGGSAVVTADLSVGGAATISGAVNLVGAVTLGSTFRANAVTYTWPATQAADRFLRTDGAGVLSWALPLEDVALADLSDVAVVAPSAGQMLRYAGPGWANSSDGTSLNVSASNLTVGTVPNGRLAGAYTGVVGLGIQTQGLQFDDALYDIGSGGKRPRDFALSRNAVIGGTLNVTGAATAASFAGDGSALTALNGTQVTTGTVAAARLATHDLVTAHTATGLTAGQVVRASGAAAFAFAVLQFADLGGVPTTIAGYGITDAYTKTQDDARFAPIVHTHSAADITSGTLSVTRGGTGVSNPTLGNLYLGAGAGAMTALAPGAAAGYVRSDGSTWARVGGVAWADLTGVPTTVGGFGITDVYTKTASDARFAPIAVPWGTITGTPTTVAGYGITDAITTAGGQTIAGALTVQQLNITKAAGTARTLHFTSAGSARWDFATESTAESGANAGSALVVIAYDDAGTIIDTPITITRAAAGTIALARHVSAGTDAAYDLGSGNRFRDLILSRDATIGRNAAVTGTLGVTGTSTLGVVNAGATTTTTLHATGAVTFDLALGAGATTLSSLHVTGAVTFDTALPVAGGGTGVASFAAGDLPYYAAGTALSAVAIGTASKMLRSTGTAPAWSTATFPNTATAGDLMVATGTNAWGSLGIGANLRVLQSNGSAAAWVANLDIGSGTLNTGAATVTTLHATGAVTFDAALGAGATTVSTLHATGAVTFDSTLGAGATTVSTLHATGAVTMDSTATVAGITSSANVTANGAAATDRGFRVTTAGVLRWFVRGDSAAESGANAGTAFKIGAYDDAGVAIDDVLVIARAAGGTLFIQRPSSFAGNVEFGTDAAYDIGATNRPRDFRLSRNASIGGTLGVTGAVTLTVALATGSGGTGLASYTAGDVLYYAAGALFSKLAIGANKTVMQSNGSAPVWVANLDIGSGTIASGAHTITSNSATGFVVGPNGTTNPVFTLNAATASQAAGVSITGAIAAGTVAVAVTSSGADANLSIDAKGAGSLSIGATSTGAVTVGVVTFSHAGAVGAVTTFAASSTVTLSGATDAASSTTGILQVAGGVGIAKKLYVGTALDVGTTSHFVGAVTADSTITTTAAVLAQTGAITGNGAVRIGADVSALTLTNSARKIGTLSTPHYTNAEENLLVAWGDADSTTNTVYIGGGLGGFNTATTVNIYAAATSTTTGGTPIATFTTTGLNLNSTGLSGATTGVFATSLVVGTDPTGTGVVRMPSARIGVAARNILIGDNGTDITFNFVGVGDVVLWGTSRVLLNYATHVGGNLTAETDASYDLGASGANRFRDFFLSRNATIGGTLRVSGASITTAINTQLSVGNTAVDATHALYVYNNSLAGLASFERNGGTTATNGILTLDFSNGLSGSTAADAIWSGPTNGGIRFQTNGTQLALDLLKSGSAVFTGTIFTVRSSQSSGSTAGDLVIPGANSLRFGHPTTGTNATYNFAAVVSSIITYGDTSWNAAINTAQTVTINGQLVVTGFSGSSNSLSASAASTYGTVIENTSATNGHVLEIKAANATGGSVTLIDGYAATSTNVFRVFTNGNVVNTNNSYGAISDERFKDVIGDAGSQLDDFRAYQFRKYRIHSSIDTDGQIVGFRRMSSVQIGLVAQEVRRVSPGLVDEDANGFLSIKYSVLAIKTAKALQEVIAIVDDYRADFDAVDEHFSAHELRILALESEVEHLTEQLAGLQPA